jgi:hypothetical protein
MRVTGRFTRAGLAGCGLLLSAVALGTGSGAVGATGTATWGVSSHTGHRIDLGRHGVPRASHVFVIVGENTSLRQVTRRSAPYLAGVLRGHSARLHGLRAVRHSSSTGNYIKMTSGQSIACERNDSNPVNPNTDKSICHQKVNNIFHQLQRRHVSWADWQESMPHPCAFYDDGTNWAGDVYGAHHNPAIYYDNIEGNRYVEDFGSPPKAICLHHDLPMGTTAPNNTRRFDRALATGRIPRFDYVVPNDCENGHDLCGSRTGVRQFDRFLRREIPKIMASPAWDGRSLIDVTWDEQGDATPRDRRVGSVWIGGQVKPGDYRGRWNQASLLRTVEDAFGLPHLAHARTAHPISNIWR